MMEKSTVVRTNLGFDDQIGRQDGHGRTGIGVWSAGNFVGIVHKTLAAG